MLEFVRNQVLLLFLCQSENVVVNENTSVQNDNSTDDIDHVSDTAAT